MFKKKTFSEIWEDKIQQDATKNAKILAIRDREDKEVENIIKSQFKQAVKTIGDKLTMSKQHDSMFNFYYGDSNSGFYTATLYGNNAKTNGTYELYHYLPLENTELSKFKVNIKLIELSQRLIQYVRLILKTKGIEV